jgi:sodium transport system permease protein
MHWPIIQLLWRRELRDLLRDRRTVCLIFLLPVALYPLLVIVALAAALMQDQEAVVGIYGLEHLPKWSDASVPPSALAAAAFSLTSGCSAEQAAGTAAFVDSVRQRLSYPPLVHDGQFVGEYSSFNFAEQAGSRRVGGIRVQTLESDARTVLESGQIDVMLIVPADFLAQLDATGRARFEIYYREGNDRSRQTDRRLQGILGRWQQQLKAVRLLRRGLPADFDRPLDIQRPQDRGQSEHKRLADDLGDMVARFFPFLLIMWALAGALHPAIDLTAGEKERATLETLLLSPASRGEIVVGKFVAVWLFSAATALWNLFWMGGGAWLAGWWLPFTIVRLSGLLWSALLTIALAALFSAVSMALGAYARSTKEGQYYLLPLFIVAMPLAFLPMMVPGMQLNWLNSLVPITGATLLLQQLMAPKPEGMVWIYFVPVLASLAVCCALALRWAVAQFRREEVLFRDSQGMDLGSRVRGWFGGKVPS